MTRVPLDEDAVLRPKDPAADEEEWDEIPLTMVDVQEMDSDEPASLLLAGESYPVQVIGRLDRLPSNMHHVLLGKRQAQSVYVKVSNVQHFAYGQDDNMQVVLWADGKAGWFKIRSPSRSYKPWYEDMVEAVNVLFFTADLVRTKRGRKLSATRIFEKLAEQPDYHCADAEDAAALYRKHRKFLLHKMNTDGEGVKWDGTPIKQHLAESDEEESDSSHVTPVQSSDDEAARLASRGKSSLRPRSGKHTKKSAKRRFAIEQDDDEEMLDVASLDSPSNLKRKSKEGRPGSSKRISISKDRSLTPKPEEELPLQTEPSRASRSNRAPPIISATLPSYEPQDPIGDVWTCTNDGCNHKVYKASTKASKELIREHFKWHAVDNQRQLDLVYKEERPYLPVGNLIRKIQEMAALESTSTDLPTRVREENPTPITRRF